MNAWMVAHQCRIDQGSGSHGEAPHEQTLCRVLYHQGPNLETHSYVSQIVEDLPVLCRVSQTYLGEQDIAEYCAGADEDEQHEVKQEDSECDNLEHQAIVVVGEVVD